MFDYDGNITEQRYRRSVKEIDRVVAATASSPTTISAESLSKIWNISKEQASQALKQNTHLYRQGADHDISRQLSTNDRMLRYRRIESKFYTDTFFATAKGRILVPRSLLAIWVLF